ncbi:monovalent cation:proton antiporter family protein [Geobacter sp. DSM 9736]|uniref:monovalent cation:proton antiporter family protein n=1 Tax=Geobacter sp. DSM 9736 TaxID=1277350 RepID=UPI000B502EAA|nr:monovalent cation:proton antiporter family protein [Geobacter sp. DSM 9736]SNB46877.1 Kef-type potassium/proton antiporter, CPA2 family [Geobacter sp. DSM 9736]
MDYSALQDLEILFGLALVTVVLFRKLLFPSIIGFLFTGMLAGPYSLGFIRNTHQVEQMAEIGVVLLLFTIGIEFSLKELMRIRQLVLWGGGLQVLLTIGAVAVCGTVFGLPVNQAVFFGFLTALSSTAILLKLLIDSGEVDTPQGRIALGILIFQDLCIVPLMLLTPLLGGEGDGLRGFLLIGVKAAAVIVAAHYGARFFVPWLFKQVVKTRSRELFILTIIFIGFGTALLTAKAGLSLALGAFIAGLAISESEYSQQALSDLVPFREAFMSLFFISVGMLLDPAILMKYPFLIAGVVMGILLVKSLIGAGAVMALGVPMRIAVIAALSLAQIGEFSFVLSQSGLRHGLLTQEAYQIFLAASIATMGLTPLFRRIAPGAAAWLVNFVPHSWSRGRGHLVGESKRHDLSGHVIIVGYGVNGKNVARSLKHLKIPYMVIETNPFTITAEKKKGERILFGDASKPEVLEHAHLDKARILLVAISDAAASRRVSALARQLNPAVHIIVRTRYLMEVEPLYKLGVNEVIPEEFETSVEILSRVLRNFMVPQDEIEQRIADVRRDGYDMLRTMSRRHSHAVGISGYLSGAEIGTYRVQKGAPLEGESLREGTIRSRSGATVLMIKRKDEVVPNPDPVWELAAEDLVLLLGTPEQLATARKLFQPGT